MCHLVEMVILIRDAKYLCLYELYTRFPFSKKRPNFSGSRAVCLCGKILTPSVHFFIYDYAFNWRDIIEHV